MTRKALFDAVRPFAPGGRFTQAHVASIDKLADDFGLPREGASSGMKVGQEAIDLIHSFENFQPNAY